MKNFFSSQWLPPPQDKLRLGENHPCTGIEDRCPRAAGCRGSKGSREASIGRQSSSPNPARQSKQGAPWVPPITWAANPQHTHSSSTGRSPWETTQDRILLCRHRAPTMAWPAEARNPREQTDLQTRIG